MSTSSWLTVHTDRALVPANAPSTRYLLVKINAPSAPARDRRAPVNVSLVLDRSGSMEDGRKFTLAREAVERALRMLRSDDCFSLVVYDHEVDVLAPSSLATAGAKTHALDALNAIEPRGSTDLGAGWLRGCEQVADHLVGEDSVSRCLLLTDGLANRGIQDRRELAVHAAELHRRGVSTSTFGVGADFDERLLRDMAHEGGGNSYFIEGAAQIPGMLTSELGEALEVTVRNAALEITLPRGADAEPVSRFRHRRAIGDNELRIELGDLVSEQELAVVVKVTLPRGGEIGAATTVGVTLTGRGVTSTTAELIWTRASDADAEAQPRDREVDREVARLYAALARVTATEANQVGNFRGAGLALERTAARIDAYAGDDAELHWIAAELRAAVPSFRDVAMPAMAQQQMLFAAGTVARSRNLQGQARKRPSA
ncbi:MAG: VWA domain-containing protein [Gemmatimonadota bacterium]|nr:VWA domain-containing protein [Gemmatimonadota bacterium]